MTSPFFWAKVAFSHGFLNGFLNGNTGGHRVAPSHHCRSRVFLPRPRWSPDENGQGRRTVDFGEIMLWNDRRKFRSQTSDNMDRWKAEQGRGREKRKMRKIRRKKMQMREKGGKSRNTVFFQWFGAPEGRKVGSLKRQLRSQLARWEMKNCTPLWHEAHFQVKMYKTHQVRTTFGSWDVEKVHAVVARSTFPSQNVQHTPGADHFWQLRCWKSARRCGAKHISKSKCTKHTRCGPLLAVEMSKKCTPLWREARLEVKMCTRGSDHFWKFRSRKSARRCARSTFWSQNVKKNTRGSDHFWRLRCPFASLHYNTLHYTTLHTTTLHYITRRYTPQHYNYNNATTLHYARLHKITLHSTTLHSTTLQLQLHNYSQLHSITRHYTKFTLHYITLHCTTLHYTPPHSATLHYTPWHSMTTLHYVVYCSVVWCNFV